MTKRCFCADALVVSGNKTLLVKHKGLGIWIFPGGHINPGEEPDKAAHRECKEETGIDVRIIDCSGEKFAGKLSKSRPLPMLVLENLARYPDETHIHYSFKYLAKPMGRKKKLSFDPGESTDARWFTEKEVRDKKTPIHPNIRRQLLYAFKMAKKYG